MVPGKRLKQEGKVAPGPSPNGLPPRRQDSIQLIFHRMQKMVAHGVVPRAWQGRARRWPQHVCRPMLGRQGLKCAGELAYVMQSHKEAECLALQCHR